MIQHQHILAFSMYFLTLLAIAIAARRRISGVQEYTTGGRSLSYWVTALSAHASDMSSWLFMAFPMLAFTQSIEALWVAAGLIGGMFFCWHFIAPSIRSASEEIQAETVSEFLQKRFDHKNRYVMQLSSGLMIFYLAIYITAGLIGMGGLFETLFHIDYRSGLVICILFMLFYTAIGGFVAVAWTDFFQAIFLLLALFIVVLTAQSSVGSTDFANLVSSSPSQEGSGLGRHLAMTFSWGLGYMGMPHILNKFMSIDKKRDMHKAKFLGLGWQIISLGLAFYVGRLSLQFFSIPPENKELLFIEMVKQVFSPFFAGLILCSVLAATISTMDSQLIVVSSIFTQSFDRAHSINNTRISLILTLSFSLAVALFRPSSVMEVVGYAWSGLGCSIGPAVFAALFMPKANQQGVLVGLAGGALASLALPYLIPNVEQILLTIPGFILNLLLIIIVSKLTRDQ